MTIKADADLYRLMSWMSPAFPVGAYSYSHGIEYAFEAGDVTDAFGLQTWIEGILKFGSARLDGILFKAGWQAVNCRDEDLMVWAIETSAILRATKELALENAAQGAAFIETIKNSWPQDGLARFTDLQEQLNRPTAYPVAVGVATSLSHIDLDQALVAFLHGFICNLVSAGVRMIPLGQTAGQKILSSLQNQVLLAAKGISDRPMDDLKANIGSAAVMVDWSSMRHETQYTRIFRS